MLSRILVANRGEIALRDHPRLQGAGHSRPWPSTPRPTATRRICSWPTRPSASGRPPAAESYLNIPRIISAAEIANVEAIHPGYGFLAENAHFAEICRDCKIEFIGPGVEAMRLLGDKIEARKLAKKAKVPTVPGSEGRRRQRGTRR